MQKLLDFFKNDRFAAMAGAELTEVGAGYAKARLLVGKQHLNGAGICQGGAVFTLADLAFAAAVNSHGNVTVSIMANITFIHAAGEGWLYAEAHEKADHPRLPYVEVTVTDDSGNVIAIMTSSGYRKKESIPG
jgi:acyl-CoA thioesterase